MDSERRPSVIALDPADLDWETWPEEKGIDPQPVRWKLAFSSGRTNSRAMTLGVAEIAAGGILPRHRHMAPEFYYGLTGRGEVETEDGRHVLKAGIAVHLPSNVWHRTRNVGSDPLVFLFMFPVDDFHAIQYEFAEDECCGD